MGEKNCKDLELDRRFNLKVFPLVLWKKIFFFVRKRNQRKLSKSGLCKKKRKEKKNDLCLIRIESINKGKVLAIDRSISPLTILLNFIDLFAKHSLFD